MNTDKRIEDVVERIVTEAMEMDIVSHEEADTLETILLSTLTSFAAEVRREERERIIALAGDEPYLYIPDICEDPKQ